MSIFSAIGGWLGKMIFGTQTIEQALGVQVQVNKELLALQRKWALMYEGKAPWNTEDVPSLQLARSICREAARYAAFELESSVEGSARADFINKQYKNVLDDTMNIIEELTGYGTIILKPYVRGNRILVGTVTPDCFYSIEYNEIGELVSVVFADQIQRGKNYYTLLETHTWIEAEQHYTIKYKAFRSSNKDDLGKETPLATIQEWAGLLPEIHIANMERPLFVEVNMPDKQSIFAKATQIIKEADEQLGRTIWEYYGGELAIDADTDVLRHTKDGGAELPKGKERLFRGLDFGDSTKPFLNAWTPAFRDESLFRGLNQFKRSIEFIIGFAYGIISDPDSVEKTAEEIRAGKHRFFVMIQGIQKIIEKAYEHLLYSMNELANLYSLAPVGDYEFIFNPGDSIMEDFDKEYQRLKELASMGYIKPEVVVAYARGITEEQAIEEMPKMSKVIE